jgi:hypothetical protein
MARPTDHFLVPAGRSAIGSRDCWFLPAETREVFARIAATTIPLLCLECSGPAFARVVAGVHQASRRARLLSVDLRRSGSGFALGLPRGHAADDLTLALEGLEELDADGQSALGGYLDEAAPRLVCASEASLDELRASWRWDLLALVSTITVRTPSLARRGAEVAEIAAARLPALCDALGRTAIPALSPRAAAALAAHEWPGDVAELEAVLVRTILRAGALIEAGDLVWQPDHLDLRAPPAPLPRPSAEPGTSTVPPPIAAPAQEAGGIEALAVELAHQLKNPLVTVKTFVQGSTRMTAPDLLRFQEVALESVNRIDEHLDQLLSFSRLNSAGRGRRGRRPRRGAAEVRRRLRRQDGGPGRVSARAARGSCRPPQPGVCHGVSRAPPGREHRAGQHARDPSAPSRGPLAGVP